MPLITLGAVVLALALVLGVVSVVGGPWLPVLAMLFGLPGRALRTARKVPLFARLAVPPIKLPAAEQDLLAIWAAAAAVLLALTFLLGRWWIKRRLPRISKASRQCKQGCLMGSSMQTEWLCVSAAPAPAPAFSPPK